MYLTHFGLRAPPFRPEPATKQLYPSRGYRRARAYLEYTAHSREGFLLLTGATGSGKSSALLALARDLPEQMLVARLDGRHSNRLAFLRALCEALYLPGLFPDETRSWRDLENFLFTAHGRGQRVLLLVDDAQGLGAETLELLRLLAEMEQGEEKLLRIILSGKPELAAMIDAPGQESLRRRVRLRYELRGLEQEESETYIEHRLGVVGGHPGLFDPTVYPLIHGRAAGLPGAVNTLCDGCLQCAFAAGKHRIDAALVDEALLELGWERSAGPLRATMLHPAPRADELFKAIDRLASEFTGRMDLIARRLQAITEELRQLR